MSRVALLPRLNALGFETILRENAGKPPQLSGSANFISEHSSLVSFAASGGTRRPEIAIEISKELRNLATGCGFPKDTGATARATFDQQATVTLTTRQELATGEALRDDVWAFIATILAPDIVIWRFSETAQERFRGGVRNAFQRLWMRGRVLDRGEDHPERWLLVEQLTEDALVQIFERASIAGNKRLARTIAETWVLFAEQEGRSSMEDIMRRAMKLVRLRNEIVDLAYLSDSELRTEVADAFGVATDVGRKRERSEIQPDFNRATALRGS